MADPKVEKPVEDDASSDSGSGAGDQGGAEGHKQSRAEKKSRKALSKMGLKPVSDITRCTIRKQKNIMFVISNPDVFKHPTSDTYVVFGIAKAENLGAAARGAAAQDFKPPAAGGDDDEAPELVDGATVEEVDDDAEVDATGVDEKDIELVMQQADVSKARAIKALKKHGGDVVNAIMDLSG